MNGDRAHVPHQRLVGEGAARLEVTRDSRLESWVLSPLGREEPEDVDAVEDGTKDVDDLP